MTNRPYPLRIPEGVLQLAELRGHEERTDKTTALRQWLYAAAEEYAFKRLAEGRLTLSQTAELLDLSVYDVQRKAGERWDRAGGHRRAIPPGPRDGASTASPTQRVSDTGTAMPPGWDAVGRRAP